MCQLFEALVHQYCPDAPSSLHHSKANKGRKTAHQADQAAKSGAKAKVAKSKDPSSDKPKAVAEGIQGIRLGDNAKRGTKGG